MKKLKTKENKGITLIALVVTTVVLILLAGTSINFVLGDNGIITKAQQAKMQTEFSKYKEELDLFNGKQLIENQEYQLKTLTAGKNSVSYNTKEDNNGTIKEILTSISNKYLDKIEIIKGEIYINTKNKSEIAAAQKAGINPNPYKIENGVLQSSEDNLLLVDETGTLRIPDSVTEIGDGAFSGVEGLKTIIIPGSVKRISANAFAFNSTLEKVVLSEGVEEIGTQAFNNCNKLQKIELPQSLTKIAGLAFYWCRNLQSVTIPSKVTEIEMYAFCRV